MKKILFCFLLTVVMFVFYVGFPQDASAAEFTFPNQQTITDDGRIVFSVTELNSETCYEVFVLYNNSPLTGGPKHPNCAVSDNDTYATFSLGPNDSLPTFTLSNSDEGVYKFFLFQDDIVAAETNNLEFFQSEVNLPDVIEDAGGDTDSDGSGLTPIESYVTSPNPYDISGNTLEVELSYRNLESGDYKLCLLSHPNFECGHRSLLGGPRYDARDVFADGTFSSRELESFIVCGDGSNKLKVSGTCERGKDYFHEGKTYQTHLYDSDENFIDLPGSVISFYVRYIFPQVFIAGPDPITITAESHGTLYTRVVVVDPKPSTDGDLKDLVEVSFPLQVSVGGKEITAGGEEIGEVYKDAGGQNRNNYQIVLEGQNVGYKREECTVIQAAGRNSSPLVEFTGGNGDGLTPGRYILKINDQDNESNALTSTIGKDQCQGGFTFFHIPILVRIDDETKTLKAYVETDEIRSDPNKFESSLDEAIESESNIPCTEGYDSSGQLTNEPNEIATCLTVGTALGNFSTNPGEFITKLFSWVLSLAGLGGFLLLLYAAYQLIYSRGDQERIQNAKETIKAVIIGYIFVVLSMAILQIIGVDILRLDTLDDPPAQQEEEAPPEAPGGGADAG